MIDDLVEYNSAFYIEGWSRVVPFNNTIVLPWSSRSTTCLWHHKV